jgi:hypothetical protein
MKNCSIKIKHNFAKKDIHNFRTSPIRSFFNVAKFKINNFNICLRLFIQQEENLRIFWFTKWHRYMILGAFQSFLDLFENEQKRSKNDADQNLLKIDNFPFKKLWKIKVIDWWSYFYHPLKDNLNLICEKDTRKNFNDWKNVENFLPFFSFLLFESPSLR